MQNSPFCIGGDNFYEQVRKFNRNRSFEANAKWADEHLDKKLFQRIYINFLGELSMKYLCLHKLFVAIILLTLIIIEIFLCGLFYILYIIWNFRIPHNFWLKIHSYRGCYWDWATDDRNPMQTFVRRYKYIFNNN